MNFGNVNNPNEETNVVLEIAYNTAPDIAIEEHEPPAIKIGSTEIKMPKFTVIGNVSVTVCPEFNKISLGLELQYSRNGYKMIYGIFYYL